MFVGGHICIKIIGDGTVNVVDGIKNGQHRAQSAIHSTLCTVNKIIGCVLKI